MDGVVEDLKLVHERKDQTLVDKYDILVDREYPHKLLMHDK
jgi:hypothetical protein